jgi:hypothetical protein
VTFLRNTAGVCAQRRIAFQRDGLPEGVRRLRDLADAVPERQEARRQATRAPHPGQDRQGDDRHDRVSGGKELKDNVDSRALSAVE